MADGQLILIAGALLAAGLLASLLALRLRVPSLVLFLGVGMAIGSDGAGWIEFSNYELARTIGVIALALILFEGGLTSGLIEIRSVLLPAVSLALIGTIATAAITAIAASQLFGFGDLESLLLGSIVAATDGAAVFALLRTSTLKPNPASTTRWRCCWSSDSSTGSKGPITASATSRCCSLSNSRSASRSEDSSAGWESRDFAASDSPRLGCTPSDRLPWPAWRTAQPIRSRARAFSPST